MANYLCKPGIVAKDGVPISFARAAEIGADGYIDTGIDKANILAVKIESGQWDFTSVQDAVTQSLEYFPIGSFGALAQFMEGGAISFSGLPKHITDDAIRWTTMIEWKDEVAELKATVLTLKSGIENKVLSGTITDIESLSQGSGYVVTNGLGGRITGKGVGAVLVSTGTVDIVNSQGTTRVYDNLAPLTLFMPAPTLVADVQFGDLVVSSGMAELFFNPYVAGGAVNG